MLGKDILTGLEANRRTATIRHLFKNQECANLLKKTRANTAQVKEMVASIAIQQWINDSCCANVAMNKCSLCNVNTMNGFEKEICLAGDKEFAGVCKDTDVFTSTVRSKQYEKRMSNFNKNYITIRVHKESELKR